MIILGIETSCDETGAAVINASSSTDRVELLSNSIASSLSLHAETGGIIPEIAAREQVKYMLPVLNEALTTAKVTIKEIDAIAVTYGPGLIGSLLVGVETAKTLSYLYKKPLIPVNHLYGHIYANWINSPQNPTVNNQEHTIEFPALALVVSGGHTDLVFMRGHRDLEVIGGTRDDAAGEAFDKIGRLIGLPYPAGPTISRLAEKGNPKAYPLPRPMIGSGDFNFSFSGLKTAVLNLTKKDPTLQSVMLRHQANEPHQIRHPELNSVSIGQKSSLTHAQDDKTLSDLCASVEEAIIDTLVRKTLKAAEQYQVKSVLLGGGVAANAKLQGSLRQRAKSQELKAEIFVPQKSLCTDNAAMIAAAAFFNPQEKSWAGVNADPELYY